MRQCNLSSGLRLRDPRQTVQTESDVHQTASNAQTLIIAAGVKHVRLLWEGLEDMESTGTVRIVALRLQNHSLKAGLALIPVRLKFVVPTPPLHFTLLNLPPPI